MRLTYEGVDYDCDDELSLKDFTGWNFNDRPHVDFNGKVVYASCFSHETPAHNSLPPHLTDCTFIKCNLDNVRVSPGATVIDCSQRRFKCQQDGHDWLLDANGDPAEPLNPAPGG